MDAILNILISLGLDKTVFYQFAIFIVTFLFLDLVVFKPYLRAYQERRKRTVDSKDVAKDLREEISSLEETYSKEAREMNTDIKKLFDEKKSKASKEANSILAQAQKDASEKVNAGKATLKETYAKAREQMKTFVPELSQDIKQRLLDR